MARSAIDSKSLVVSRHAVTRLRLSASGTIPSGPSPNRPSRPRVHRSSAGRTRDRDPSPSQPRKGGAALAQYDGWFRCSGRSARNHEPAENHRAEDLIAEGASAGVDELRGIGAEGDPTRRISTRVLDHAEESEIFDRGVRHAAR